MGGATTCCIFHNRFSTRYEVLAEYMTPEDLRHQVFTFDWDDGKKEQKEVLQQRLAAAHEVINNESNDLSVIKQAAEKLHHKFIALAQEKHKQ